MDEIETLLTRGVANIIPSKEELLKKLKSGKLNIYLGVDPTGLNMHIGHMVLFRKLKKFADLGHNVTFLIGDFTALIGDTSDKDSERPQLTESEIGQNVESFKILLEKRLGFDLGKISVKQNSEWLSTINLKRVVEISRYFSFNDFLSRELIKKRLSEGQHIGFQEFMYPMLQGLDSLELNTDLQLGGTDQTFNMQAGRTLIKNEKNKESFILTMDFLTGTDGRKMSKTWNNAIWLSDNAETMFGKVMSLKDDLIVEYFTLATDVSEEIIDTVSKRISEGENPMNLKKELAKEIVKIYYNENEANKAEEEFRSTVQDKNIPDDIIEIEFKNGQTVSSTVVEKKLVSSVSEWKRLIDQHGVYVNGRKIDNPFIRCDEIHDGEILKIGKRNYVKIKKS